MHADPHGRIRSTIPEHPLLRGHAATLLAQVASEPQRSAEPDSDESERARWIGEAGQLRYSVGRFRELPTDCRLGENVNSLIKGM